MASTSTDDPLFSDYRMVTTYREIDEAARVSGACPHHRLMAAPFEADSVLKLAGDEHKKRRRLESVLFKPEALGRYERDILRPTIDREMARLKEQRGPDGVVRTDLVDFSKRLVVLVTGAIIGLDGLDRPDVTADLYEILNATLEGIKVEWFTGDRAKVVREGLAAMETYRATYVAPAVAQRRAILAASGRAALPTDLISLIVGLDGTDDAWGEDLLLRECVVYLVGAGATTPTMVTHAVVDLAGWLEQHPADRQLLDDDDFLGRVIEESIRLHPPTVGLLRDYPDGYDGRHITIEAGEALFLDVKGANMDPSVFGERPEEFNPNRELPAGTPRYGMSFGGGRHLCLGLPIAIGSRGAATSGAALLMLRALLAAGVRLDPERLPRHGETMEDRYAEVCVVFDDL